MYRNKSIAVVIPAYNEERQIAGVITSLPDWVDYIVAVNDASTDCTGDVVRKLKTIDPRVILIDLKTNQGCGGALSEGYLWARDHACDIAVRMDGDGQMDPAELSSLLDPVVEGRADYTKGNRLVTGEAFNRIPKVRYFGNAFLSLLTKIASGYWHVADFQSGYTAINRQALHIIDWDKMYKRYGQPNDLLVRLNIYSFRVRDVTVRPVYGVGERSGIKPLRMIPRLSWLLFRLFLYRMGMKYVIRDFHPLVFFYAIGMLLFPLGFLFGVYLMLVRVFSGPVAGTSALFAALMVLTGLQFLLFAMWFDMDHNKGLK